MEKASYNIKKVLLNKVLTNPTFLGVVKNAHIGSRMPKCVPFLQFQIYSYVIKLNGNRLICVYNIHNFKLFPFVIVKLNTITYLPMQSFYLPYEM